MFKILHSMIVRMIRECIKKEKRRFLRFRKHKFPRNRMFLLSRIEITFAGDERCFHEVSGVSPEVRAAWMGSRSSNGDPQLSNLDNETFARNRSSIVFHRTSAIRVSNFDRRRATWSWPFVFGDFPGLSKGGSLDFSRPNPPPHCSAHWIGEPNEVFSGDPLDPLNRYTHYGTRKFRNPSSPMEIPFETFS